MKVDKRWLKNHLAKNIFVNLILILILILSFWIVRKYYRYVPMEVERKNEYETIKIDQNFTTNNLTNNGNNKSSNNAKNEENKESSNNENNEKVKNKNEESNTQANKMVAKKYPKEEFAATYRGYDVCAKLEIPAINLETNVLKNYSVSALNISVTKFWGVEPNRIGNCCIAGHNFINKNMFRNLKKLKIGDKLFLTDKDVGKVEYEVFSIEKVSPKDVSCLEPVTYNEREVTLITCTLDSQKRIIVKAKEV